MTKDNVNSVKDNVNKTENRTLEKPLTSHWADRTAFKIVKEKGEKELYTLASGITPSGVVHVGNFRELVTTELVGRALKSLGKNTRFIFSWDDYDVFRKIPQNIPEKDC